MKKRVLWAVIMLVLAAGIVAGIHKYQNRPTTMNELVEFWRDFYGSNRVVELPERDGVYGLLNLGTVEEPWWTSPSLIINQLLDPVENREWERKLWDDVYTGELHYLYTEKEKYKVGEDIIIYLVNKSEHSLGYGAAPLLNIEIDGIWYPVFSEISHNLIEYIAQPGIDKADEISVFYLFRRRQRRMEYNEESRIYEYETELSGTEQFEKYYKDKTLIPGHYRYMNTFDDAESGETYNLACEFYVTR